jgi:serine/threonine-protein kinase
VYTRQGKFDQARATGEQALELTRRLYGDDHPDVGYEETHLGAAFLGRGDYGAALPHLERAREILARALGEGNVDLGDVDNDLGLAYQGLGRNREAVEAFSRALAELEKGYGAESVKLADTIDNLAVAQRDTVGVTQAIATEQRALALRRAALRPDHPDIGNSEANLGELLRLAKRWDEALPLLGHALAIFEKQGKDHFAVSYPLTSIGRVLIDRGQPAAAVEPLERAAKVREKTDEDPAELGDVHFALAQALDASGPAQDRPRARTLATRALEEYRKAGKAHEDDAREVSAWLDATARSTSATSATSTPPR